MKTTILRIKVPDDFKKGECEKCPINGSREEPLSCFYCLSDCPLEIQEGYSGCRNCKYQEAPLTACDFLKRMNTVRLMCQMWKPKEIDQ